MFDWILSAVDGIQTILLMMIIMKTRPRFWKILLFVVANTLVIEVVKPLVVAQGPSFAWNSLIAIMAFAVYVVAIQWIFQKPFHFALVSASYLFVIFFLFQLFSFLIMMILGLWINFGENMLMITEIAYYSIILCVEIFQPKWLRRPHQHLHAFVARRTYAKMLVDILLVILLFLFTTSFIFEAFHESPYMSNRIYSVATFSLVFVMAFIVLLRAIIQSHKKIDYQKNEVHLNSLLMKIDQMLFQGASDDQVLTHLSNSLLAHYPDVATCEAYIVATDQHITIDSSASPDDNVTPDYLNFVEHQKKFQAKSDVIADVFLPSIATSEGLTLRVPIVDDGDLFALLSLSSKDRDTFDDEDLTLARSLKDQLEGIIGKHRAYRQAIHASTHDDSTGLYNRRHTEEKILAHISDHENGNRRFALVLITLLGLDEIRADYGDDQMQAHVKDFADFLKAHVEEATLIGRYSENEFLLIFSQADRMAVDTHMSTMKVNLKEIPFSPMKPHFHYGVSFYPDTSRSLTRLITAADQQIVVNQRLKEGLGLT